jgi:hypothetical protein
MEKVMLDLENSLDELIKSAGSQRAPGHKYIKRTGTPGNYKYWYKMPDGSLKAGDHGSTMHKKAQKEHAQRLIAGKKAGHHRMSNRQIAEHAGLTSQNSVAGLTHRLHDDHGFDDHHMHEAKHTDVDHPDYHSKIARHVEGATAAPAPEAPAPEAPAPEAPAPEAPETMRDRLSARKKKTSKKKTTKKKTTKKKASKKKASSQSASSESSPNSKVESLLSELAELGVNLKPERAEEPEQVQESLRRVEAAQPESNESELELNEPTPSPASEGSAALDVHAQELAEADPDYADSETAVGGLPTSSFLDRAKAVFDRVSDDLQPKRKDSVMKFFQAVETARNSDGSVSKEAVKAVYDSIRGGADTFNAVTRAGGHLEVATSFLASEVIDNPPIDMEVERMKRGFAKKQFDRLKPYLGEAFKASHPDAPPPYPTYSDLATWGEFGTAQADHITTPNHRTQRAMPQEFYDSIQKGSNGKALMPPADFPLHLTPIWNYMVKEKSFNPYQTAEGRRDATLGNRVGSDSKIDIEANVRSAFLRTLKKYVQNRGGAAQLVDIPRNKLVTSSYDELFKSDDLSDEQLLMLARTKVITPAALFPFAKDEVGSVSKSFELYVDADAAYIPRETLDFYIDG